MKKLFVLFIALIILTGFQVVPVIAGNITIYDKYGPGDPGGNTQGIGAVKEDNEVENGANTGQKWDLEAFFYNSNTKALSMVGGYDFQNGIKFPNPTTGTIVKSGDIFIDTNGVVKYGNQVTSKAMAQNNLLLGYEFAIKLNTLGNVLATDPKYMTYDVYAIQNQTLKFFDHPNQIGYAYYSGPFQYTPLTNQTPLFSGKLTQTAYADPYLGLMDWTAGLTDTHFELSGINLTQLTALGTSPFFHFSFSCGNDAMDGKVPLPGAVLLLGAGMARLAAYARRRRNDQA
jgi:hypothetical protein